MLLYTVTVVLLMRCSEGGEKKKKRRVESWYFKVLIQHSLNTLQQAKHMTLNFVTDVFSTTAENIITVKLI